MRIETIAGEHISQVAERAVAICVQAREPVEFMFNGIELKVAAEKTAGDIEAEYTAESARQSEAYWTPERLAEKAWQEDFDRRRLAEIEAELASVNLTDLRAAVRWLRMLAQHSRTHAVPDAVRILARFAVAGLAPNMNLSAPSESTKEWRVRVGEDGALVWLIGQALDGIRTVGCPHQMIHGFVDL